MLKTWISSEFQSDPRFLSPHATDNYRPDIDGLRAFAVLSVVLYHAFPKAVRGGYVGVDIFFVISGFLISSILFTEMTKDRFSFTTFYGRRIRRIFPALAVCLAAVLAYGFVSLMPFELAQLGKHVFFGAGFLSNIVLWSESGYFDSAASLKPLLHLWSLGIEEQFYILWPALLWMAFRIKAKVGRLLAVLFVASFAINVALSITNISDDFYLPVSRFWELLAGAGLAWRRSECPYAQCPVLDFLCGLSCPADIGGAVHARNALSRLACSAAGSGSRGNNPSRPRGDGEPNCLLQPCRRLRRTDKLSALYLALATDFLCLCHSYGQGADALDGYGTLGCEFPAGLGHLRFR